jgi:hypothetical protein
MRCPGAPRGQSLPSFRTSALRRLRRSSRDCCRATGEISSARQASIVRRTTRCLCSGVSTAVANASSTNLFACMIAASRARAVHPAAELLLREQAESAVDEIHPGCAEGRHFHSPLNVASDRMMRHRRAAGGCYSTLDLRVHTFDDRWAGSSPQCSGVPACQALLADLDQKWESNGPLEAPNDADVRDLGWS